MNIFAFLLLFIGVISLVAAGILYAVAEITEKVCLRRKKETEDFVISIWAILPILVLVAMICLLYALYAFYIDWV